LYIFAISHFCEKSRWALDYLGIDYQLVFMAPGLHMRKARSLGLPATSLPILQSDDDLVQGSADIVDWAEPRATAGRLLTPPAHDAECRALEQRLDQQIGVHTRRYFYSETLLDHSQHVKAVFLVNQSPGNRIFVTLAWPFLRRKMIEAMDIGEEQGRESRDILESELNWLEGLLADGRPYLAGDTFTRADIAACALLARLASAQEHPYARTAFVPPRLAEQQAAWRDRPVLKWVRAVYRKHRQDVP